MIAAALVAAIAAAHVSLPTQAQEQAKASGGKRVIVEIRAFKFAPRMPDVAPGDTVVWVNKDIVPHTVTARDGSWDSGKIKTGARWQMVVKAGQSPQYYCKFHPAMKARLQIARKR